MPSWGDDPEAICKGGIPRKREAPWIGLALGEEAGDQEAPPALSFHMIILVIHNEKIITACRGLLG